jgi:plastocyanin
MRAEVPVTALVLLIVACLLLAGCTTSPGPVTPVPTVVPTTPTAEPTSPTVAPTSPTGEPTSPSPVETTVPATTAPAGPVEIELVARGYSFNTGTITVPAGSEVRIQFNNQDTDRHNVALYEDRAATRPIFVGELITGPRTITYSFTAPALPGTYRFQCDPHASFMNGDFIVT